MLSLIYGDITKVNTHANHIVSAGNGLGLMPSGVAGAIRKAGGSSIEFEALKKCLFSPKKPGTIVETKPGLLLYQAVLHVVTTRLPGSKCNLATIETCLNNLVNYCRKKRIKSAALPLLGAGVGELKKEEVASLYKQILEPVEDIQFVLVEKDFEFIQLFSKL